MLIRHPLIPLLFLSALVHALGAWYWLQNSNSVPQLPSLAVELNWAAEPLTSTRESSAPLANEQPLPGPIKTSSSVPPPALGIKSKPNPELKANPPEKKAVVKRPQPAAKVKAEHSPHPLPVKVEPAQKKLDDKVVLREVPVPPGLQQSTVSDSILPAKGQPASYEQGAEADRYLQQLRKQIRQQQFYPRQARLKAQQGQVLVDLLIARDGRILRIQLAKTSRFRLLDDAALKAIRLLGPLPPLPNSFADTWQVQVPMDYRIRQR